MGKIFNFAGRMFFAPVFILGGVNKIADWSGNSANMAAHGMRFIPLFLAAAIVVELTGGTAVLLGYKTRWFALLLFLYLVPTTLIFHSFWIYTGAEAQAQMTHFMKNLSIMGGLLLLAGQSSSKTRRE